MRLLSGQVTALQETPPLAPTPEELTLSNLLINVSEPKSIFQFLFKNCILFGPEKPGIPHKKTCYFSCKLKIGLCIFKMSRNAIINPTLFSTTIHRNTNMHCQNAVLELTTIVLVNSCIIPQRDPKTNKIPVLKIQLFFLMKTAQIFKLRKMGNHGNSLLEEWEEGAGQTKGGVQHLIKEIVSGNDKIKKC